MKSVPLRRLIFASSSAVRTAAWGAFLAVVLIAPPHRAISAQSNDPSVPLVLRLPASTVALGMGNVGVALTDADAVFYNAGMLTQARGVAMSMQRYGSSSTSGAIASVQSLGSMSYGVGARFLDSRTQIDPPGIRAGHLSEGGNTPVSGLALTAAAARAVGPLRVGVGATYVRETQAAAFDESALFDVGVAMPMGPMNAMNATISLQHVGAALSATGEPGASPWQAVVGFGGAGYPLATFFDVSAATQLHLDQAGNVRAAVGAELAYMPVEGVALAGRVGIRSNTVYDASHAVTAGVGFSLDRYSLDYAFEPIAGGSASHRVGVRVR